MEQAQKVLDEVHHIEEIALQGQDPLCGPLRLGVIFTISPYLMPGLVHKMLELAPKMPLILTENYTGELLEQLRAGQIDVAIMALPIHEPGLMLAPLYDEELVVAVPHNHPWANQSEIHREDVRTANLLLLGKGHCLRDQVLAICPESNGKNRQITSLQKTVEGSSLLTIHHMVAQGLGITVLPSSSLKETSGDDLVKAIPFNKPTPTRRVIIAWRKSFTRLAAIDMIRQAVSSLPMEGCRMLNLPPVSSVSDE